MFEGMIVSRLRSTVFSLNATDKLPMYDMPLIYVFGFGGWGYGVHFLYWGFGQWHFAIRALSQDRDVFLWNSGIQFISNNICIYSEQVVPMF